MIRVFDSKLVVDLKNLNFEILLFDVKIMIIGYRYKGKYFSIEKRYTSEKLDLGSSG